MSDLRDITKGLGESYRRWKDGEKDKNDAKDAFFEAATQELRKETPAQIYEKVSGVPTEEEARKIVAKKFPSFTILDVLPEHDGFRVALEENPELRPFTFVNPEDRYVYQRQVSAGAAMVDDERLKEEAPALWAEISHIPQKRVLKPLEELTPEQLAALEPYIYSSKPVVKLAPPRKAKAEELDQSDYAEPGDW